MIRGSLAIVLSIAIIVFAIFWLMDRADERCADKGGRNIWLGGGLQHICVDAEGRIIR